MVSCKMDFTVVGLLFAIGEVVVARSSILSEVEVEVDVGKKVQDYYREFHEQHDL